MCRRQGDSCKTCIGNDCNEKVAFTNCRVCNSTTNVNCIRSPNSFASVTCRDYIDECYSHVDNDIVVRGCLKQNAQAQIGCERNNDLCERCDGPNCNNKLIDGEFCLTCDSENDPNCVQNLNFTMRTQCKLALQQRGCYRFDDTGSIKHFLHIIAYILQYANIPLYQNIMYIHFQQHISLTKIYFYVRFSFAHVCKPKRQLIRRNLKNKFIFSHFCCLLCSH